MNYTSGVFLNDLNTGRKYESQILQNIKLKYPCSFLIDKKFKDYDKDFNNIETVYGVGYKYKDTAE